MKTKLHTFLQSDLIDKYIYGTATDSEILKVEYYISKYPEVKATYNKLQDNLEILAKANAAQPPEHVLDNILNQINTKERPIINITQVHQKTPWYAIAASVTALIFAITALFMYQQNSALLRENQVVVDEIFDLRSDIKSNNSKLDDLASAFMKVNNPETEKYVLRGDGRAKDLKTIAYINPVDKTSMIDIVSLPEIPDEKTYEIWAEVQNRMVKLSVLDTADRQLKPIPYMENAVALGIFIGEKNGNTPANIKSAIAEVSLR